MALIQCIKCVFDKLLSANLINIEYIMYQINM